MPGWAAKLPIDPSTGGILPHASAHTTGVTARLSGKHMPDGKVRASPQLTSPAPLVQASYRGEPK